MVANAADAHAHGGDAEHGLLHHHFDDLEQQRECGSIAMWLFLMTEIMMFGGLFFVYSLYRGYTEHAFVAGSRHLNIALGTVNTFVLLFSSLTMALAVHGAQEKKKKPLIFFLCITWLLGLAFLVVKGFEWTADYHEGLIPAINWLYYSEPGHAAEVAKLNQQGLGPHNVLMYFCIYFCMTGLHAIHMIVGLILVGYFIWLAKRGKFTNGNDQPVELLGLYWHFVDIVWIFLFPLLYLLGGFHPGGGGH